MIDRRFELTAADIAMLQQMELACRMAPSNAHDGGPQSLADYRRANTVLAEALIRSGAEKDGLAAEVSAFNTRCQALQELLTESVDKQTAETVRADRNCAMAWVLGLVAGLFGILLLADFAAVVRRWVE